MEQDKFHVEILGDGTIKMTSDPISGTNHASAEQFFRMVGRLAGGKVSRVRKPNAQIHSHTHKHEEVEEKQ